MGISSGKARDFKITDKRHATVQQNGGAYIRTLEMVDSWGLESKEKRKKIINLLCSTPQKIPCKRDESKKISKSELVLRTYFLNRLSCQDAVVCFTMSRVSIIFTRALAAVDVNSNTENCQRQG